LRVFSMRTSLTSCGETPAHMTREAATAMRSFGMTIGVLTGAGVVEVRALRYVEGWSIFDAKRSVTTSAMPSPLALPPVSSVRSRKTMRSTAGPPVA
jgi:hypothetical protein